MVCSRKHRSRQKQAFHNCRPPPPHLTLALAI
jgi:hypothetical protein